MNEIPKAFEFAYLKHRGGTRKISGIPYIVHPMSVAIILMENNASENLVIAGLLHDVLEDTDTEFSEIQNLFGDEVTKLVMAVTEPLELKKAANPRKTWKRRKQHTIDRIKTAERDVRILTCADKLSNIKDLISNHDKLGDELWEKFNAPKIQQEWYYRSLCSAFVYGQETIINQPIYQEFREGVEQLFKKSEEKINKLM